MYFFTILNGEKSYPLNKFVIFDHKIPNMGSLGENFVIFDQKLNNHEAVVS